MNLHQLLHSVAPDAIHSCIAAECDPESDRTFLELVRYRYLPQLLRMTPEDSGGEHIYIVRGDAFRPMVAFCTVLGSPTTLASVLSRSIMISDPLRHLPPERLAALCFMAIPMKALIEPSSTWVVSRAYDPESDSLLLRNFDTIRDY